MALWISQGLHQQLLGIARYIVVITDSSELVEKPELIEQSGQQLVGCIDNKFSNSVTACGSGLIFDSVMSFSSEMICERFLPGGSTSSSSKKE